MARQLFTQALLEIVPEIPEEPKRRLMLHMERILDRLDVANARQRADTERERAALARHRQMRAEEREAAARASAEDLAGRQGDRLVRERLADSVACGALSTC